MKPHSIKQHFNSVQIPNQNDFLTEQSGTQVDTGNMNFPLTTLEIIPRSVLTQAYQVMPFYSVELLVDHA